MSTQFIPLSADIRGEAFPVLTAEQINRIRPLSRVRKVKLARDTALSVEVNVQLVRCGCGP